MVDHKDTIEQLQRELVDARAEVDRLRRRVRVEAEDIERVGIGWKAVVMWLRCAGWVSSVQAIGTAWRPKAGSWTTVIAGDIHR